MQLLEQWRSWWNASLSFFYPEWCQICDGGRATPAQGYVCECCRGKVERIIGPVCRRCGRPFPGSAIDREFECGNCREQDPDFDWARAAALAKGPLLEAIHQYKYRRGLWCEPFLAELLVGAAAAGLAGSDWEVMVPVPLYPTREREREFNQAERLGRHLSRATGIPLDTGLIRRVVPTVSQTQLGREQRRENMRKAFEAVPGARLAGKGVVIVDDVLTTGWTASACARELRRAGASRVCVWTVGRGH